MKEKISTGGTFIDIGANFGLYSIKAGEYVGAKGKVLSIEPNSTVMSRLVYNAKLNGYEDRIVTENTAVADKTGDTQINLEGEEFIANGDTLLSIAQKHGITKIDGLKFDVEGAEDKALIPFFNDAPEELFPDFIIIETSDNVWKSDLIYTLQRAAYTRVETTSVHQIWERNVLVPDDVMEEVPAE